MGRADLDRVIDWLIESDEPAVRYRARRWLQGRPESDPAVGRDRVGMPQGPIVSTLLEPTDPAVNPYRKWFGVHWRLVSLADFAPPVDRADVRAGLDAAIDRELTWIANPRHLEAIPLIDGLYRADASMEGNAVYAASRFGHARDPRTPAARRRAPRVAMAGRWLELRSTVVGVSLVLPRGWATAIGLAAYHDATGDPDALSAARRTAELLLDHRLFRSLDGRRQIHSSMAALHWPAYWHYDLLAGLRVLLAVDRRLLADVRAADALDLLESKAAAGRPLRHDARMVAGRSPRDLADRCRRLGEGPAERGADAACRERAQGGGAPVRAGDERPANPSQVELHDQGRAPRRVVGVDQDEARSVVETQGADVVRIDRQHEPAIPVVLRRPG